MINLRYILALTLSLSTNGWAEDKSPSRYGNFNRPNSGGTVQSSGESPRPSEFTGAMSYRVSFDLPPGPANFSPELGLNYHSRNGIDTLGIGWSFSVSSIRRDTGLGIPDYDFKHVKDAKIPFKLGESLVFESEDEGISTFRLERSSEFISVEYHSRGFSINSRSFEKGWLVKKADGVKVYYPTDPCAIVQDIEDRMKPCHEDIVSNKVSSWLPRFYLDKQGNTIEYRYKKIHGQLVVDQILYGKSKVQFNYFTDARPDTLIAYSQGFPTYKAALASSVSIYYDEQIWKKYCFNYDGPHLQGTLVAPDCKATGSTVGESLLRAHRVEDKDINTSVRLKDIYEFASEEDYIRVEERHPEKHFTYSSWMSYGDESERQLIFPVNGFNSAFDRDNILIDLNQDSLPDILRSGRKLLYSINSGRHGVDGSQEREELLEEKSNILTTGRLDTWFFRLNDMDGDRVSDIIEISLRKDSDSNYYLTWYGGQKSKTSEFFSTSNKMVLPKSWRPSDFKGKYSRFVDIDGDGLSDIITIVKIGRRYSFKVLVNHEGKEFREFQREIPSHQTEKLGPNTFDDESEYFRLRDMNADGLVDLVFLERSGFRTYFNQGNLFQATDKPLFAALAGTKPAEYGGGNLTTFDRNISLRELSDSWFVDANGDGLKDLVNVNSRNRGELRILLNRSNGRMRSVFDLILVQKEDAPRPNLLPTEPEFSRVLDIDGDGMEEILFSYSDRIYMIDFNRKSSGKELVKSGLLTRVSHDNGLRTSIAYTSSTAEYLRDVKQKYSNTRALPRAISLVKRVVTQVPHTKTKVSEFYYHDGHYDYSRREFIGFKNVDVVTIGRSLEDSNLVKKTYYDGSANDGGYAFSGQPKSTVELALEENTYLKELITKKLEIHTLPEVSLIQHSREQSLVSGKPGDSVQTDFEFNLKSYQQSHVVCLKKKVTRHFRGDDYLKGDQVVFGGIQETLDCDQYGARTSYKRVFLDTHSKPQDARSLEQIIEYDDSFYDDHNYLLIENDASYLDDRKVLEKKYEYFPNGLLDNEKQWIRDASYKTTSFTYDEYGNPLTESHGSNKYTYTWLDGTFLKTVVNPLKQSQEAIYDCDQVAEEMTLFGLSCEGNGRLLKLTNANKVATYFEYDSLGRVVSKFNALSGLKVEFRYKWGDFQSWDRVLMSHSLPSNSGTFQYLNFSDQYGIVRAKLAQAEAKSDGTLVKGARVNEFLIPDAKGKIKSQFFPFFLKENIGELFKLGYLDLPANEKMISLSYDHLGRLLKKVYPNGKTHEYKWEGYQKEFKTGYFSFDGVWQEKFEYVLSGPSQKVLAFTNGNKNTYSYDYDGLGRLISVKDPLNNEISIDWNGLSEKAKIVSPSVGILNYIYDDLGRIEQKLITNHQGSQVLEHNRFTFDKLNRVKQRFVNEKLAFSYQYDRKIEVSDNVKECLHGVAQYPIGKLSEVEVFGYQVPIKRFYAWDQSGNLRCDINEISERTFVESHTYDMLDRPIKIVDSIGFVREYDYQDDQYLRGIPGYADEIFYNEKGQLDSVRQDTIGLTIDYQYDPETLSLTNITSATDKGGILQKLSYQLDGLSHIVGVVDEVKNSLHQNSGARYTYDDAGQLVTWQASHSDIVETFVYDEVGNFKSNPLFSRNPMLSGKAPYQPSGTLDKPYLFDEFGRLQKSPSISAATWGYDNKLTRITTAGGGDSEFAYDHTGRRVWKSTTDNLGQRTETYFPSENYHEEHREDEIVGYSSVFFEKDRVVKVEHRPSGSKTFWSLRDHLQGSNIVLSDLGEMREQIVYSPYGTELEPSGRWKTFLDSLAFEAKPRKTSYRFTGHYKDEESNIYYAGERYYDQSIGRFISPDPLFLENPEQCLKSPIECNLYSYGKNNPMSFKDSTGLVAETPWDGYNFGLGAVSLSRNLAIGNYGWATVDAAGMLYDGVSTLVPGLPGGASTFINVMRYSDEVVDAGQATVRAGKDLLRRVGRNSQSTGTLDAIAGAKAAEQARDATAHQLKRKHATYSGGYKDGKVVSGCSSNPTGCAEDSIARQLGSDANMTKAVGWRRNKTTRELELREIPVCVNCQSKYSRGQFPKDVKFDSGGAWSN
ncbi:toxin TcdB middle/N-terminal domain-containing protein [Pseudobacteriovorax antillogorgiicola]|uniref:RHS repeat-associated core domain-containing protein n=1 Tax=Pseudobacteriovorax antillogorgiicola TaxID=1513793 RepID=A0A1Y6C841_9BACT|nr:toxin TcdB middle/N-terminal domain-containing protein [Pseudobacteriovorax antillogorgiicola]TCS50781.1 RHS repeat-associated protein [Pseudobacteriovorax antillogorgiicola]SMF41442.1 RHS repeat-associated core domain-containing protein [Pseudobacteriovorax antillogorgiicola]